MATSAIRDARNGAELLAEIKRTTGLEARVISGSEEARYGWLAMANSTTVKDGFGLDIGGGSIQGMRLEGRQLAEAQSLPLGAVRVSERFLPDEKASAKQMKALRAHVAGELEQLGWWSGGGRLVGIGGTIRNLAAAAMKRLDIPDIDVQGFQLTHVALEQLIEELAERPASKRAQVQGHQVRPRRRDPGRRPRARHGARRGRVRRDRGDRGGAARGHLLRAAARRGQAVRRRPRRVRPEPRASLRARQRARPARVGAVALDIRRACRRGPARLRRRGARAALGRLPAARHRGGRELRRPPPPLPLPHPQRRPARVRAARADPDRPGRPLPPQGRAGRL